MATSLQVQQLTVLYCSSNSKKIKKQKQLTQQQQQQQQKQKQIHQYNNKISFRKPTPTPLLINQKPYTQTKTQALDSVVNDLEASVERGIKIDIEIFSSLLETCYHLQAIDHGIRIHRLIPVNLLRKNVGLSSKLLRLYALCGHIDKAHDVFDEMSKRDISAFAWNSLISGYTELGQCEDAMALYFQMEEEGVEPDAFTFPRVLKACGGIGLVRIGEEVHRHVVRCGFANDGFVLNALVDMYAKCGDIVKARKVFDKIASRDLVSWNAILTGYVRHGLLVEALAIFDQMLQEGYEPDSVAISTMLTTCAHLGLVKDGERLYSMMRGKYRISPIMEHYACMVNLYGRAGLINEAYATIVETMEFEAGPTVWGALLYACLLHGNVDIGEIAAEKLFELEPDNEHNFELLMNIYRNVLWIHLNGPASPSTDHLDCREGAGSAQSYTVHLLRVFVVSEVQVWNL
ncbi:pentatricopeptide repeat-containing protein [Quercus suber]|uniref:Pentatricopeptide repeat-containing protein n=1 Tax=Quercus suber TaxID=58331 RepID=A0AAW0LWJ5_QUESU